MVIKTIKVLRHKLYISLFRCLPLKKNKIIFWADSFKHYGCSPKYIAEFILKEYPERFDLVWVFEEGVEVPEELPAPIRVVKYFSIDYLKELHTAKFVLCNMRTGESYYWKKRKNQVYIQTWHSSLRLKKIEKDAIDSLGIDYEKSAIDDSSKIDLLLSGCDFSTAIFKRAFWYDGEILESGTPRSDILINAPRSVREKVFDYYGIPNNKKLVLYAPTFRDDKKADLFGMDFRKLSSTLGSTNEEWVIGCRLHPNILGKVNAEGCISMSGYSDMQELICAADLLITDYSSCMFDMATAKKPCVLYAPDLKKYTNSERGLYFDIQKLPFPLSENMDELCRIVAYFDLEKYNNQLAEFMSSIGSYEDGKASARVVNYIIDKM